MKNIENKGKSTTEASRALKKEELEFLPAALEVIETPPSPAGRSLMWLLIALFVIALAWSIVGKIDEVAVASGKVIPSGYTKTIQAESKGIVSSILIQNGSHVKAGELLIELDTTLTEADIARLGKERSHYALTTKRLLAESEESSFDLLGLEWCDKKDIVNQIVLHEKRVQEHSSRLVVADKNVKQAEESLKRARINKEKLKIQLSLAKEREERTRFVAEKGGISRFTWQEYLEKYLALQQDLLGQESEILRSNQALEQARAELKRLRDEREKEISEQLVEASHKLRLVEEELKKAQERHRLTYIRSPIDGTVQQLEIHTTGGIVTEAQQLLIIVPNGEKLNFEVWAENRDIGFIYEGQKAEIKVETFNFQKYGTLDAVVNTVATEAVEDRDRGLIYRVLLSSDKDYFIVGDKKIPLISGMAVTAEIKTRQKRVIEYFLEPFKTYVSEGLRER